ncbi:MAG: DNA alkylation repair protein [Clostridia bacterium]|nr:DNA alkylation repair protein [Clostridia bacterium]MDD4386875.1 DNA alkylation repair protein [Clostridia bacterium]
MELNNKNWTIKEYDKLIVYLKEIGDEKYKNFHKNLVPGLYNMIGIQMPKLRVIAKAISMGNYMEYLTLARNEYYEETVIQGLIIGYVKEDYINTLKLIESFLPNLTNWAICDSFCIKFKSVVENRNEFLIFLQECIKSEKEYYIRFAVVMFKVMYIDEKYIDTVLNILDNICNEGYYVKMAVAWTLCDCFIKFEDKTMNYLNSNKLDNFTYNKVLQKIVESNRVDKETKETIKKMKRKKLI